jgi:enoyl-CoA hydratase/carnithine racemase
MSGAATPVEPPQPTPEEPSADAGDIPVRVDRPEAGICVLTLARPRSRNSLSLAMMEGLRASLAEAAADRDIAAVVLAAQGTAFCSGHDLKELTAHRRDADAGRAFYALTMRTCAELMQAIVACPKPVIAAVQATATAAGCQLVATCDLAVAAESAAFCTPGVNIGLFCSTPMVALSRNVSRKQAMELLLLGDMLPAEEAAAWGLINRAVPREDVLPEALDMARRIASKPQATVATGKRAFYAQIEQPLADAYEFAVQVMVENMLHAEAEEGISAFLEKRPPAWPPR